jgi:hypothetical protein
MEINFEDLYNQLKTGLLSLIQTTVSNYANEAKTTGQNFIDATKTKLQKWTTQLANGDLTTADFESLVYSQGQLFDMNLLKQAGLAEIRIEQFKGSVLNLISDTVFKFIKI